MNRHLPLTLIPILAVVGLAAACGSSGNAAVTTLPTALTPAATAPAPAAPTVCPSGTHHNRGVNAAALADPVCYPDVTVQSPATATPPPAPAPAPIVAPAPEPAPVTPPTTEAPTEPVSDTSSLVVWASTHTDDLSEVATTMNDSTTAMDLGDYATAARYDDQVSSMFASLERSVPTGTTAGDTSHTAFGICKTAYRHAASALRTLTVASLNASTGEINACASATKKASTALRAAAAAA
jgi:hypothetical protein